MAATVSIQRGPDFQLRASFLDGACQWEPANPLEELFRRPVVQFEICIPRHDPERVLVDLPSGGIRFGSSPIFFANSEGIENRRPILAVMADESILIGWQGNDASGHNHRFTIQIQ